LVQQFVSESLPAPASASVPDANPRTAGYSYPPFIAKKPCGACVAAATAIVLATAAPVDGVARPAASSTPPAVSVTPATMAFIRPGRKPADSR
jgi:hypothetical protein